MEHNLFGAGFYPYQQQERSSTLFKMEEYMGRTGDILSLISVDDETLTVYCAQGKRPRGSYGHVEPWIRHETGVAWNVVVICS